MQQKNKVCSKFRLFQSYNALTNHAEPSGWSHMSMTSASERSVISWLNGRYRKQQTHLVLSLHRALALFSHPRRPYHRGADVPIPCIHMRRATSDGKLRLIEFWNFLYFSAYIWYAPRYITFWRSISRRFAHTVRASHPPPAPSARGRNRAHNYVNSMSWNLRWGRYLPWLSDYLNLKVFESYWRLHLRMHHDALFDTKVTFGRI